MNNKDTNKLTTLKLLTRIISYTKEFRKPLLIVFICILAGTVMSALSQYFISKVFDLVQKHGIGKSYHGEARILFLLAVAFFMVRIEFDRIRGRTEVKKLDVATPNSLTLRSITKFFSFSNGQHINEHSGVKQSIVNNGVASIQSQINLIIVQLFPALTSLIVALGILIYAHWMIGLIFICSAIIFYAMMYDHNKKLIPGTRKIRDRRQINSRLFSEMYRFVTLVKNENQEAQALKDVELAQQKHQDLLTETWIPGVNRIQTIRWVSSIINYGTRFLALDMVFQGTISLGVMYLVFAYSGDMMQALWQLTGIHKQFLMDKINIERYLELLEVKPDIVMVANPTRPEKLLGGIEFKNVSFHYPQRVKSYEEKELDSELQLNPVLHNVSFKIKSGEKIGIVGESGSGKSTLANLLLRNFDPQSGEILIDGNDLRVLDVPWLLRNVGLVEQQVELLDRSVRDNILFGLNGEAKNVSNERLLEIAKLARIDGFFSGLEHGFDTIVGEKGVKLSGGERQRIGIARALAKKPSMLIFDEATSALDSVSEQIVQQSIDEVSRDITTIIIAHRLSTVKNCDRIMVFRHGILLDEGTHDELLGRCEYYAELVAHQMMQ